MASPTRRGRCHICQGQEWIRYCELCRHWFCESCRERWFRRGIEFLKELTGAARPGCCGPRREERHA